MKRIHLIGAARPNYMKIAPLYHALKAAEGFEPVFVNIGQHKDARLTDSIFRDMQLPRPAFSLAVGSGTHAEQTARTMVRYEELLMQDKPDVVVVPGDVNATLACAVTAAKLGVKVVHLEAGLRSYDRSMPEEINRIVVDSIANRHWTPSVDAELRLREEGIDPRSIVPVGNFMVDAFALVHPQIRAAANTIDDQPFILATFHRPSNVDTKEQLVGILRALGKVAEVCSVVWPMHPRTIERMQQFKLIMPYGITGTPPMTYIQFMAHVVKAQLVITDSGGVQEETTMLDVPCATVRENTERPITCHKGTNVLVSTQGLEWAAVAAVKGLWPRRTREVLPGWDGKAAERAVTDLRKWLWS